MYYPEGMKAWVNSVQSIKPRRILAPTWDLSQASPESRLHTGARVNLVLLTYYLLT